MQYTFSDIVDIPAVQTLMDNLWKASGIPTGIIDIDGSVLIATGWQDICTKFHRQHPETERRCRESDASITERLKENEGPIEYHCQNGMIDIGVPIVIEGRHLATIFLGQFFYEPPDVEFFRRQGRHFGFDEEAYLNALEKVPIFTRQKVKEILDFNAGLVNLLTRMGVENLRQLEMQRNLVKSEGKFRALFENSNDAAYIIDPEGTILEVNQAACEQFGWSQEELLQTKVPDLLSAERAINFSNRISEIQEKGRLIFETVHLRKDGSLFPAEVSIRTFDYLGKTALLGTFRDISERKLAEEKVLRQKKSL
jgi:PAS domain S-box-containing protein